MTLRPAWPQWNHCDDSVGSSSSGLVSAGTFLAHAIEGYCTHASVGAEANFSFKQGVFRSLQWAWARVQTSRCIMRNHDLVSGGFLAVTAAGFVLLCTSLVTFAFS
jgi:hypothetical protein